MSLKKSVSDGKSSIASAITAKGVTTEADATFETMANNINNIKSNTLIFTSSPANVASVLPNIYSQLTTADFMVGCTNANVSWSISSAYAQPDNPGTLSPTISYNSTTGILTFDGSSKTTSVSGSNPASMTLNLSNTFAVYKGTIGGK